MYRAAEPLGPPPRRGKADEEGLPTLQSLTPGQPCKYRLQSARLHLSSIRLRKAPAKSYNHRGNRCKLTRFFNPPRATCSARARRADNLPLPNTGAHTHPAKRLAHHKRAPKCQAHVSLRTTAMMRGCLRVAGSFLPKTLSRAPTRPQPSLFSPPARHARDAVGSLVGPTWGHHSAQDGPRGVAW